VLLHGYGDSAANFEPWMGLESQVDGASPFHQVTLEGRKDVHGYGYWAAWGAWCGRCVDDGVYGYSFLDEDAARFGYAECVLGGYAASSCEGWYVRARRAPRGRSEHKGGMEGARETT
jgi:hypothetical protein